MYRFCFFRADTFSDGINVLRNISCGVPFLTNDRELLELVLTPKFGLLAVCSIIFCTPLSVKLKNDLEHCKLGFITDIFALGCFFIAICELEAGAFNPFIYFRF